MNEIELHQLWIKKHLPINLKLVDGRNLNVLHFGYYNSQLAGPDFSMGIIHLDEVDQIGPIEIHVKSSDWYKHKHDKDSNYDNVILHVVYEHDQEVIQKDRVLPTLELKNYLTTLTSLVENSVQKLPCSDYINSIGSDQLYKVKEKALLDKNRRKLVSLGIVKEQYKRRQLYKLLGNAFGFSVNAIQFNRLTERVPIESLLNLSCEDRIEKIYLASDVMVPKLKVDPMQDIVWNKKGLRPSGFPRKRVEQFATIVAHLLFKDSFVMACIDSNLKRVGCQMENLAQSTKVQISKATIEHLMINCFVPFSGQLEDVESRTGTAGMVANLRSFKAENNQYTRVMTNSGFLIENAFDSQSLNAHYKNSCSHKKCLSCGVGKGMLNRLN